MTEQPATPFDPEDFATKAPGQSLGRPSRAAKAKAEKKPKPATAKAKVAKAVKGQKAAKAAKAPKEKKLRGEGVADRRAKEAELIKKYPQIVPGSLRFEDDPKSTHYNKQVVTVKTRVTPTGKFDGGTRELATSDCWQVWGTPEAMHAYRLACEQEKRGAAGVKKPAKKAKAE